MRIISLTSFVLLFSCGSTSRVVVMDAYKDKKIKKEVLSYSLPEFIDISNDDDVFDDIAMGEDSEKIYRTFFIDEFPRAMQNYGTFKSTKYFSGTYKSKKVKYRLADNIRTVEFSIPTERVSKNRFFLQIKSLKIFRNAGTAGTFMNGAYTGGSSASLRHNGFFYIWDNEENKIVSYGEFNGFSFFTFSMGKDNWKEVLKQLAKNIVEEGPFKKNINWNRFR